MAPVDGLVVVDKPPGCTSHDVVARCRRIFGQRRVGHAGTLDPDATGVLLVGLGRVTRLLRFLTAAEKTYEGELVLGVQTTTLDSSGEVVATYDMAGVGLEQVRGAAEQLVGDLLQVPPMVSAVKVGGRRLHQLARAGAEVERPARPVTVHRFEITGSAEPGRFSFVVSCSSGTYVRVLAADLGVALGGAAHLARLCRTAVGEFGLADAHPLDAVDAGYVLPPAEALRGWPRLVVDDEVAAALAHGAVLDPSSVPAAAGPGPWAVVDGAAELLAVCRRRPDGRLQPEVVLAGH